MTTRSRIARPAARLLVIDPAQRILLFRFTPPAAAPFWATPGGAVDPGETYGQAARRELYEETGYDLDPGPEIAQRSVEFTTIEGQDVLADERYFMVRGAGGAISDAEHTELERRVMTEHRWWTLKQLRTTDQIVFPEDLADLIEQTLTACQETAR